MRVSCSTQHSAETNNNLHVSTQATQQQSQRGCQNALNDAQHVPVRLAIVRRDYDLRIGTINTNNGCGETRCNTTRSHTTPPVATQPHDHVEQHDHMFLKNENMYYSMSAIDAFSTKKKRRMMKRTAGTVRNDCRHNSTRQNKNSLNGSRSNAHHTCCLPAKSNTKSANIHTHTHTLTHSHTHTHTHTQVVEKARHITPNKPKQKVEAVSRCTPYPTRHHGMPPRWHSTFAAAMTFWPTIRSRSSPSTCATWVRPWQPTSAQ
jgi:hypothetical protein